MRHRRHSSIPQFLGISAVLVLIVFLAIHAVQQARTNNKDATIHADLVNIRQEADIISDGGSYKIICQDKNNIGYGLPVGIIERPKIDRLVQEIAENSPNPKLNRPVCSVSVSGDLLAIFSQTSQGSWCVDSKGYEGLGDAEAFEGVCRH